MKHGVYIHDETYDKHAPTGVGRKITYQIAALERAGMSCSEVVLADGREHLPRLLAKMFLVLPFTNYYPRWDWTDEYAKADFLYIRRPLYVNYGMLKTLRRIKKANDRVKIVMEIPTYPFSREYTSLLRRYYLLRDIVNRLKLRGLVDRIAVIGNNKYQSIWGIPAVDFINGYDVQGALPRHKKRETGQIHLGCIAMFSPWHGYDRLLSGLVDYYMSGGNREIIIHMVGEGPELDRYKGMAKNPHLADRVMFHGMLNGSSLRKIYDLLDIGVTSLGNYRKNIDLSSELKSREYLAVGVPMITGCTTDVLSAGSFPYFLQFPNDPSNIDFFKVEDFYDTIYRNRSAEQITMEIRRFAFETIDINKTFLPVIDYLNSNN